MPHPNADILSIVKVFGYTCVVRTQDWKDRSVGAYIPPDSAVPDTGLPYPEKESAGRRKASVPKPQGKGGLSNEGFDAFLDEATHLVADQ